jgi:hypothetical protein
MKRTKMVATLATMLLLAACSGVDTGSGVSTGSGNSNAGNTAAPTASKAEPAVAAPKTEPAKVEVPTAAPAPAVAESKPADPAPAADAGASKVVAKPIFIDFFAPW